MGGTPKDEGAAGALRGPDATLRGTDAALRGPDAGSLRLLRGLVTTLTAVMIAGIVAVVALLVVRMPDPEAFLSVPLPEALRLPEGAEPRAFTRGPDWFAVVTADDRILIYGADGTLRQQVRVEAGG